MELIKLLGERAIRILKKDPYVPIRCYAHMYTNYEIKTDCRCDCKNWCKFPPKGGPPSIVDISIKVIPKSFKTKNNILINENFGVYYSDGINDRV